MQIHSAEVEETKLRNDFPMGQHPGAKARPFQTFLDFSRQETILQNHFYGWHKIKILVNIKRLRAQTTVNGFLLETGPLSCQNHPGNAVCC